MRTLVLAACFSAFTFAGQANAMTCPEPSQITQAEQADKIVYTAPGNWEGDTPMGQPEALASFRFTGSKMTSTSVICRYEADNDGGTRLALPEPKKAVGAHWMNMECKSGSVYDCLFE
ncbi:DUF3757 domain-containing protein [Pseudomonas entomophila]|uniref:DUF3757 domain-containing protein n=1 Tax=Pseudomonas entomophila TaxID=312306 RepID=UPI0015E2CD47|nr:DUF3757 domain-containing protein [Pseudomonas entomophila]MBA1190404.1 DUF3757 domain-containing protein [Pseudomonas entomophila]